ncbi:MAG: hypothetical protein V3V06_02185, partial [Dehalococcoidia bacterium]
MADDDQAPAEASAEDSADESAEKAPPQFPPLLLNWMHVPTEWGVRAEIGKAGYTLANTNVGGYGEVPATWDDATMKPRGSHPFAGAEGMGYAVFQKQEVWADSAADLYEEAIQRAWKPATDIPWDTIPERPAEMERALAQLLTILSERCWAQAITYGQWFLQISYGFHEIKLFLSTVVFSLARQTEAFRKRSMVNGGGVGVQGPAVVNRAMIDARNFTEMILINQLAVDTFTEVLLGELQHLADNEADTLLFRLARQDRIRALAYGQDHLRYVLREKPERREELHSYLSKAELAMARDLRDTISTEALS